MLNILNFLFRSNSPTLLCSAMSSMYMWKSWLKCQSEIAVQKKKQKNTPKKQTTKIGLRKKQIRARARQYHSTLCGDICRVQSFYVPNFCDTHRVPMPTVTVKLSAVAERQTRLIYDGMQWRHDKCLNKLYRCDVWCAPARLYSYHVTRTIVWCDIYK